MLTRKEFLTTMATGFVAGVIPPFGGFDRDAAEEILEFQSVFDDLAQDPITLDDLKVAMKMADLEFTDEQLNPLVRQVTRSRAGLQELRDSVPSWTNPPAHSFRTYNWDEYTGDAMDAEPREITNLKKPSSEEDLAFLSVVELGHLLRAKQVTSVELTKLSIARLKKYGDKLLCLVTLLEEQALAEAKQADQEIQEGKYRGALHGIPYGIKDLFAVKGHPTTWGSEPHKEQVFDFDATVVEHLREAGAILVAKLSLGALAQGDVWFKGRTESPWNKEIGSSGSSAGSASAVAAGLVPFAIGTETSGSIVSPSHNCRVTGLRPTFGQVSRYGAMPLSWSMDKVGPICRDAEDCATVFPWIARYDERDGSSQPGGYYYQSFDGIDGLNVGYLVFNEEDLKKDVDMDAYPYLKLKKEMGVKPKPIYLPSGPGALINILYAECSSAFDAFTRGMEIEKLKNSSWPSTFRAARFIPATDLVTADRARRILMKQYHEALKGFDVVIAPDRLYPRVYQLNLTGQPQVLVPFGEDDRGRPVSFSLISPTYNEYKILRFAYCVQKEAGFHLKRPDMSVWE